MKYEAWQTFGGRSGIQRTLDPKNDSDCAFLEDGIRIVDDDGNEHPISFEEAERMGIRRVVASRDLLTGELKWRE